MLSHLLTADIFAFMLIFIRTGAGIMLLPGIGEIYVPARVRLMFALAFAFALMPVLAHRMPVVPSQPLEVLRLVTCEAAIGLFLGAIARILIATLDTAGTVIAMQSGLATAMMLDITQTTQSSVVTNLLSVTAVTVLFAADLHHLMLSALAQSYDIFAPGTIPPLNDTAMFATHMVSRCFAVAIQLASPQIVIGSIVYLAAGVMSRLMPTMQILFVVMAPQIMVSLFILMVGLSGMMMFYMGFFQDTFGAFISWK